MTRIITSQQRHDHHVNRDHHDGDADDADDANDADYVTRCKPVTLFRFAVGVVPFCIRYHDGP